MAFPVEPSISATELTAVGIQHTERGDTSDATGDITKDLK